MALDVLADSNSNVSKPPDIAMFKFFQLLKPKTVPY
jgi:hypothetical protein